MTTTVQKFFDAGNPCKEGGWQYDLSDIPIFEDLEERLSCLLIEEDPHFDLSAMVYCFFSTDGTTAKAILRRYKELNERDREELFEKYTNKEEESSGLLEARLVLGSFDGPSNIYDELKTRWNLHYPHFDDQENKSWVQKNIIKTFFYDFSGSPINALGNFGKKFSKIKEAKKDQMLRTVGDLCMARKEPLVLIGANKSWNRNTGDLMAGSYWGFDVGRVLSNVTKQIPRKMDYMVTKRGLKQLELKNSEVFVYLNRDRLIKFQEDLDPTNIRTWHLLCKIATNHQLVEQFTRLSPVELNLTYQAYSFAKGATQSADRATLNRISNNFSRGFTKSLESGDINHWANHIVNYFRRNSKGGGHYRVLTDRVMGVSV